jgi:transglutaminase-like putative cysteine protease
MLRTPRPWWVAVLLAGLLLVIVAPCGRADAAVTAGRATPAPRFGPVPSWVSDAPALDPTNATSARGQRILFADRQIRVDATGADDYYRVDREIVDTVGLQQATQVVVSFDPSYETLTIHSLAIVRDGQVLDRLDQQTPKVIQREANLERQIYDGELSVVLLVDDVRVGDVVRFAFTRRSAEPLLEGHYSIDLPLAWEEPVERLRLRFLTPAARSFAMKVHAPPGTEALAPQVRTIAGYRESVWDRVHVPRAPEAEAKTPSWYVPVPVVEMSDFESWDWVSRWGARVFAVDGGAPALRDWVERAGKDGASKEDLVLAAARFVQDEIRYVGVEVGAGRFRPGRPADVMARRFGDCKDKAALLVALLRAAGITARPALVSTSLDEHLEDWSPSPARFDHVIVEVQLHYNTYWIDATESLQGGSLVRLQNSAFARTLPLDPAGAEILRLEGDTSREGIQDEFRPGLPPSDAKAVLTTRREYHGPVADQMRRVLVAATPDQIGKIFKARYQDDYPSIVMTSPLETNDDRGNDTLSVTAHFEIPDFWSWYPAAGRWWAAWHPRPIESFIPIPASGRIAPLAIPYPLELRQTTTVVLAFGPCVTSGDTKQDDPAFQFHFTHRCQGRISRHIYDLTTRKAWVDASEVDAYRSAVDAVKQTEGGSLYIAADGFNTPVFCALLGVFGAVLGASVFVARRARKASRADGQQGRLGVPARLPAGAIVIGLLFLSLAVAQSIGGFRTLANALSRREWASWTSVGLQPPALLDVAKAFVEVVVRVASPVYLWFAAVLLALRRPAFRLHLTIGLAGALVVMAIGTWGVASAVALKQLPEGYSHRLRLVPWAAFWLSYLVYVLVATCMVAYAWRSKRMARALGLATPGLEGPARVEETVAATTGSSPEASPHPPDPACIAEYASPPSCRPESTEE